VVPAAALCPNHDSQVAEVRSKAPPDAPLLDLVEDPAPSTATAIRTGPMVRLVDAATALEALDPDPEIETAFSLSVSDPLVDWNDETFRVAVADGTVAVEPTVDGEVDKSEVDGAEAADAAIDIGTLSQLYVGYTSVDEAVRSDGLAVGSALADDDSRAVFPPRTTHLREGF